MRVMYSANARELVTTTVRPLVRKTLPSASEKNVLLLLDRLNAATRIRRNPNTV
jgi:hypothetical protein